MGSLESKTVLLARHAQSAAVTASLRSFPQHRAGQLLGFDGQASGSLLDCHVGASPWLGYCTRTERPADPPPALLVPSLSVLAAVGAGRTVWTRHCHVAVLSVFSSLARWHCGAESGCAPVDPSCSRHASERCWSLPIAGCSLAGSAADHQLLF